MDDSDNNSDTKKPNATKKYNIKQHEDDNKRDTTNETDPGPPDGPPDSPQNHLSQKSTSSPNSTRSVLTNRSGSSGSSNDSLYDRYSVQSDGLRVYKGSADEGEDSIQVPQGSYEHLEMRACVNAAMRILGRTQTRDAMVTYSIGIVDFMEANHKHSTAGDLDVYGAGMHARISKWLDDLGAKFPNVYISPSLESAYGETIRFVWGTDILKYDPESAARISLHSEIFERMCALKERMAEYKRSHTQQWQSKLERLEGEFLEAQKSNDPKAAAEAKFDLQEYRRSYQEMGMFTKNYEIHYERSLFQLAATLAHEAFHVLTGYWSGFTSILTPPRFSGPNQYENEGEAGEWWSYKHGFNGSVDLVWNRSGKGKDDPYPLDDENMSAGVPFLKQTRYRDDGPSDGEEWTRISHTFIKDFLKKGKSEYVHSGIDFRY